MENKDVKELFIKYVSQSVMATVFISAYILADTFFIAKAEGESGVAALNLVLPVYSLIFAVGAMIGIGSATRFKIYRARKEGESEYYLSNSVFFAVILGMLFAFAGIFFPENILRLLGADSTLIVSGTDYTRIFMIFAPFFMLNYIANAFVRNDGATALAMAATILSSFFNIVMDYVFMFPMKMGMAGAALATGISPVVGVLVCTLHFLSKNNTLKFKAAAPSPKRLLSACKLGVAAFVGEIASGVTTAVFNFLILDAAGNVGIAAYAVVANIAMVATAVFNGVTQGTQPLFSGYYGKRKMGSVLAVLKLSLFASALLSAAIVLLTNFFAEPIADVFGRGDGGEMVHYAVEGMRIYFLGYIFTGFNIIGMGYLSATAKAASVALVSVLRGFIAITAAAFVLAAIFGMRGIWAAFPVSEFIMAVFIAVCVAKGLKTDNISREMLNDSE